MSKSTKIKLVDRVTSGPVLNAEIDDKGKVLTVEFPVNLDAVVVRTSTKGKRAGKKYALLVDSGWSSMDTTLELMGKTVRFRGSILFDVD